MATKRFIVFVYDTFYPNGGAGDIIDSFDTLEQAKEAGFKIALKNYSDYVEIMDIEADEDNNIQIFTPNHKVAKSNKNIKTINPDDVIVIKTPKLCREFDGLEKFVTTKENDDNDKPFIIGESIKGIL